MCQNFRKQVEIWYLSPVMWWQLINNNEILKAQMQFQQKVGVIDPSIVNYYGIIIHKYTHEVGYNVGTSTKSAMGSAIGGNVVSLGLLFVKMKYLGLQVLLIWLIYLLQVTQQGRAYEFGFSAQF